MIKRLDDYEAEQREQERIWRELRITDDDDDDGWWGTPRLSDGTPDTA